uniref:superoxide dismutase n=1 Tax=Brassica oleracea TaxID=3712 RepID=A0A3P6E0A7_BRAOL|nr:unnamed protein product [Brassica oleracea]
MVHRSFLFSLRSSACLKERWRVASSMGLFFPDLCFTGINFFDPFRKSGVVARRFSARLVSCGESSPLRNPGGFRCISPTRTRRLGRRVSVSSSWWWRVQVVARRRRQVVYGSGGFLVLLAMDWEEEVETCSPAPINWNQPVITDVGSGVMISGFVCVSFLESGLEFNEKRFSRKVAFITAGFELKPPPYPLDALEPHMSQETLDYHWGKHHKTYVENLNKQIVGTDLDGLSLEEVVLLSYNRGNMLPAFNNVAQLFSADHSLAVARIDLSRSLDSLSCCYSSWIALLQLLGADRSLAVARIDLLRSFDSLSCSYSARIALLRLLLLGADRSLAVARIDLSRFSRSLDSLSCSYSAHIAILRLSIDASSMATCSGGSEHFPPRSLSKTIPSKKSDRIGGMSMTNSPRRHGTTSSSRSLFNLEVEESQVDISSD